MSSIDPEPAGELTNAIVDSRTIATPPEAVFGAFKEARRVALWWGPAGFSSEIHEFEFRPDGRWRLTMRGPDGAAHGIEYRFVAIEPPGRIVIRQPQRGHEFTLTITLVGDGGGTRVEWHMKFDDPAEAARLRTFLQKATRENLERLDAHVSGSRGALR